MAIPQTGKIAEIMNDRRRRQTFLGVSREISGSGTEQAGVYAAAFSRLPGRDGQFSGFHKSEQTQQPPASF